MGIGQVIMHGIELILACSCQIIAFAMSAIVVMAVRLRGFVSKKVSTIELQESVRNTWFQEKLVNCVTHNEHEMKLCSYIDFSYTCMFYKFYLHGRQDSEV